MAETGFLMLFPLRKECVCAAFYRNKKAILIGKVFGFIDDL